MINLNIKKGLFVTSSEFSRNIVDYARKQTGVLIDLWNKDTLKQHWLNSADRCMIALGKTGGRSKRVTGCLCIVYLGFKRKRQLRKEQVNQKKEKTRIWIRIR